MSRSFFATHGDVSVAASFGFLASRFRVSSVSRIATTTPSTFIGGLVQTELSASARRHPWSFVCTSSPICRSGDTNAPTESPFRRFSGVANSLKQKKFFFFGHNFHSPNAPHSFLHSPPPQYDGPLRVRRLLGSHARPHGPTRHRVAPSRYSVRMALCARSDGRAESAPVRPFGVRLVSHCVLASVSCTDLRDVSFERDPPMPLTRRFLSVPARLAATRETAVRPPPWCTPAVHELAESHSPVPFPRHLLQQHTLPRECDACGSTSEPLRTVCLCPACTVRAFGETAMS